MRKLLNVLALSTVLAAAASSAQAAQVSFGVSIGQPPPPRGYVVPAQPGPDYEWVEGYWYPVNGHYAWHNGYWTRPPYQGAYWQAPYYYRGHYYAGYWDGDHGHVTHSHQWDRSVQRDDRRYQNNAHRDRH